MRGLARIIAVLAAATSGCSALWVEHVPKPPPREVHVRCTQSRSAPVFDSLVTAVASAVLVGSALGMRPEPCDPTVDCMSPGPNGVFFLALGGVVASAVVVATFGASATYGYVHTARCRALGRRGELRWASARRPAWLPEPDPRPGAP